MKTIKDFDWGFYLNNFKVGGKWSVIIKDTSKVLEDFKLPEGYCLKLFKGHDWQGTLFIDALVIKNIFWIYGLAPRSRGMIEVGQNSHKHIAFVMEYIDKGDLEIDSLKVEKLKKFAKENFITPWATNELDDMVCNISNWRNGLYLDFGGFKIDKEKYKEKLIKKIITVTHFGKSYQGGKASYQSIPEWELDGKRKTDYRIEKLKLNDYNFKGKTVLDIGCNLGIMLHYAKKKGAISYIGYDLPELVEVAKEFANFNEVFDMDFYGQDLSKNPPKEKADIVFYLAMSEYLGFPKWLPEITNEILFYEGHAKEDKDKTDQELKKLFPKVEFIGYSEDRSIRPLFICLK